MIRVFNISKIMKLVLITILVLLTINTIFIYSRLTVEVINQKSFYQFTVLTEMTRK